MNVEPYLFSTGAPKTFFAERFGMVADRFGVSWMVLAGQKKPT